MLNSKILFLFIITSSFAQAQETNYDLFLHESFYHKSNIVVGFEIISLHKDSTYTFVWVDIEWNYNTVVFACSKKYKYNSDTLILESFGNVKIKYLQKDDKTIVPLSQNKRGKYKRNKKTKFIKQTKLSDNYKQILEQHGFFVKPEGITTPDEFKE